MLDFLSRRARVAGSTLSCLTVAVSALHAQLPSLPAAQSSFPAPGFALALDAGHADGRNAVALAGATGVRRLQLTGAVGLPGVPAEFERRGVSLGARLAVRAYRTPTLGVAAFAGYGAEWLRGPAQTSAVNGGATSRPNGRFASLPVGISVGVRRLAGTRPYALSIAPMFTYTRWAVNDTSRSRGGARVAGLAEIAVTPRIGIGIAGEVGSAGPDGSPFPGRRTAFGAGISYAIQRAVAR